MNPPKSSPAAKQCLAQASQLRSRGLLAQSLEPLLRAAAIEPGNAVIQHDIGLTQFQLQRYADAVKSFEKAIRNNPRFAHAFWRLGECFERLQESARAIAAYRSALAILPSLPAAQFKLANLLETAGHRTEAAQHFRNAAAAPRSAFTLLAGARADLIEACDAEAEQGLRAAIALDPANAGAQELLGNVLANDGRFQDAAACYKIALQLAPRAVGIYYELARARRLTNEDKALLEEMQRALQRPGLDSAQLARLHLGIGKAFDDLGDYRAAMLAYDAAHAIRKIHNHFDLGAFEREVDQIISRFDSRQIQKHAGAGPFDRTPILILGMPRSGTTLCEHIVSSHHRVAAGGELHFWGRRGAMLMTEKANDIRSEFIADAGNAYLEWIGRLKGQAERVTDKMPFNFLWAGLVHICFPKALIIHCRRNPIDTGLSIHQTHFGANAKFPTGGKDLVGYFRAYHRLMAHWRAVLPADRFLEIDYEALTETPEPLIREIVARAGLPWDDACLHPEMNPRAVKTPSKWQVRRPINRASIARWKKYQPYLGDLAALVDASPELS